MYVFFSCRYDYECFVLRVWKLFVHIKEAWLKNFGVPFFWILKFSRLLHVHSVRCVVTQWFVVLYIAIPKLPSYQNNQLLNYIASRKKELIAITTLWYTRLQTCRIISVCVIDICKNIENLKTFVAVKTFQDQKLSPFKFHLICHMKNIETSNYWLVLYFLTVTYFAWNLIFVTRGLVNEILQTDYYNNIQN